MSVHCVACGKQNIPEEDSWKLYRCTECWQAFKAAGGIVETRAPIVRSGGITTGGQREFCNHARYCRRCGRSLISSVQRVRFALLRGGECHTCDDCHNHRKHPEWYPDPLTKQ